jgi:hypothetical protein
MGIAGVAGSNSGVSRTMEESIEKRSIGVYRIEMVSEGYSVIVRELGGVRRLYSVWL